MRVEVITFDADPERGGFGTRVHHLVRMLAQFAEVRVVLTDWPRAPEVPNVTYDWIPVTDNFGSKLRRLRTYYKTDFPRRVLRESPDAVFVESLDLLGLHQYGKHVPLVLDEHNVYWELLGYEMVNAPFFRTWIGRREWTRRLLIPHLLRRARAFEIRALRRATQTLVTSETDRALILASAPELDGRIHVLPNCVDVRSIPATESAGRDSQVLFVGNYNYVPNREAAEFISMLLAPALPRARFLLVGSSPPTQAASVPNVTTKGFVRDLLPVLQSAAVCVAPLSSGSGTRLKILTYLAAGKAVVGTSKACEGLDVRDEVHLLIRDDPEGFMSAVRTLLENPNLRRSLGARGRKLVGQKYDWRVHVGWLRGFVTGLPGASPSAGPRM